MPPIIPLDIQWFSYAIVENGVLTESDALSLYRSLGLHADLESFAQKVFDRLSEGAAENDAQALLEQIQSVAEYASGQAAAGELPPRSARNTMPAPVRRRSSAESGREPERHRDDSAPASVSGRELFFSEAGIDFSGIEIDCSGVNSFDDLPGFSDVPELSDEELAGRLIFLLACLRKLGCSDLHLSGGAPPFVRCRLEVVRIDGYVLTAEDSRRFNTVLLSPERRHQFERDQDSSFALAIGTDRFRVALMDQKDGVSGSYRLVPDHIRSLEELGFLDDDVVQIRRLLDYTNGLVLVTGPIGAGKTSTLAAMTDIINEKRRDHIISIEEPSEILQMSKNCQVTQREVGRHTVSYPTALKASLREDPDVIVIGEMHDLETIENAITASETGHLVIGTLHTGDAANTLNRILDVFPPAQQPQIRAMTAGSLRGVICQRLIPDGFGGLAVIYEILINTMAVGNIINEGKTFRLKSTMVTANKQGMCTFDQCILAKFTRGLLSYDAALAAMTDATIIAQLKQLWATEQAKQLNQDNQQ